MTAWNENFCQHNVIPYLCFCVHTVHGFANASYDVEEGGVLDTLFELNVTGTTSLPLVLMGNVTSEMGTASE